MAQQNPLSHREEEVVRLLLEGKSNKQIASSLGISENTVEFHLKNIYAKHQVSSRVELILKLGNSVGVETENPGLSVVDANGGNAENDERSHSANGAITLREAVSKIGKEIKMTDLFKVDVYDEENRMTFFGAIHTCLVKYAQFHGRATRPEFWWFTLFVILVSGALAYLSEAWASVFLVAVLLPLLAVGARRLHDIGKSGWWQLFLLVPMGFVVVGTLWVLPSTEKQPEDTF